MKRLQAIVIAMIIAVGSLTGCAKTDQAAMTKGGVRPDPAKQVVAYQIAQDGAMQLTFEDGTGFYFEHYTEVLDHLDEIENLEFIYELEDTLHFYSGETQLNLIELQKQIKKIKNI